MRTKFDLWLTVLAWGNSLLSVIFVSMTILLYRANLPGGIVQRGYHPDPSNITMALLFPLVGAVILMKLPRKIILLTWLIPLLSSGMTLGSLWLFQMNSHAELPFEHAISPYEVVLGVVYPFVGAFILVRKPGNPIGLILCVMGLAGAVGPFSLEYVTYAYLTVSNGLPLAGLMSWVNNWAFYLGLMAFILLILLFPDAKLHPPLGVPLFSIALLSTLAIVTGTWIILWDYRGLDLFFLEVALPEQNILVNTWIRPLVFILPPSYILAVISLLWRFRRATLIQRMQLKWFLYAGMLFLIYILIQVMIGLVFPRTTGLSEFFSNFILPLVVFAFPVAIANAILRYQLFEIDLIIQRTLVYSTLTIILGLVYFVLVLLLQTLFRSLTGESNQIAIVASTLSIAALFNPLRKRIQENLDQRFYRKRYNAQQTLQAFAASMRDEVDLDELSARLEQVVQETIQPQEIILWIKKDG